MYPLMKDEIRRVVTKGKAAGVLRLVFHDAGTFELDDNTGSSVAMTLWYILIDLILKILLKCCV